MREEMQIDNKLIPLSYSGICDPQETIVNKEVSVVQSLRNSFIESFKNPYY